MIQFLTLFLHWEGNSSYSNGFSNHSSTRLSSSAFLRVNAAFVDKRQEEEGGGGKSYEQTPNKTIVKGRLSFSRERCFALRGKKLRKKKKRGGNKSNTISPLPPSLPTPLPPQLFLKINFNAVGRFSDVNLNFGERSQNLYSVSVLSVDVSLLDPFFFPRIALSFR